MCPPWFQTCYYSYGEPQERFYYVPEGLPIGGLPSDPFAGSAKIGMMIHLFRNRSPFFPTALVRELDTGDNHLLTEIEHG